MFCFIIYIHKINTDPVNILKPFSFPSYVYFNFSPFPISVLEQIIIFTFRHDFGYILFPSRTSQRMHQLLENRMRSVDERR